MKIIEFYRKVLESVNLTTNEEDVIRAIKPNGESVPVTLNGKPMVLPTRDILDNPNWDKNIGFHPLSESIVRKDSDVFKELKSWCMLRLWTETTKLITKLISTVVEDGGKGIPPELNPFLEVLEKADKKFLSLVTKYLLASTPSDSDKRLINIYIKRGGDSPREAVVTFPAINDLVADDSTKFRKTKDVPMLKGLFALIYPEDSEWSTKSTKPTAPGLSVLLDSYAKMAERLNSLNQALSELYDGEPPHIDIGYVEYMDDLAKLAASVPALPGNQGETVNTDNRAICKPDDTHQSKGNDAPRRVDLFKSNTGKQNRDGTVDWRDVRGVRNNSRDRYRDDRRRDYYDDRYDDRGDRGRRSRRGGGCSITASLSRVTRTRGRR